MEIKCSKCNSNLVEIKNEDKYFAVFCNSCGHFVIKYNKNEVILNEGELNSNSCSCCNGRSHVYFYDYINNFPVVFSDCIHCDQISYKFAYNNDDYKIFKVGNKLSYKEKLFCYVDCICTFLNDNEYIFKIFMGILFLSFMWYVSSFLFLVTVIPLIIAHEYGHLKAMEKMNIKHNGMLMIPGLGMVAQPSENIPFGKKEFYVSIAGPLVGYIGIIGMLFTYLYVKQNPVILGIAYICIIIHLFNLLPICPFDGGRMFRSSLCLINNSLARYTCFLFYIFGIVLFCYTKFWVILCLVAFVGYFEIKNNYIKENNDCNIILGLLMLFTYFEMIFCFILISYYLSSLNAIDILKSCLL